MPCIQSRIDTDKNENEMWIMDDESFSWVSRSHLEIERMPWLLFCYIRTWKQSHCGLQTPWSIMFNVPFSPGVCPFTMDPSYLHQDCIPLLLSGSVWQSILFPASFHQGSTGSLDTIFPVCPSKFSLHPSSCSTPLEVDISGLHKLGYWHLISSWFQPVGGISRR